MEPALKSQPVAVRSLADRMALLSVPGTSVAVIHNREVEWARGYGVREQGLLDPITEHTLFQACSISKPVTAMAVMRLVQEGRLSLDEDVNAYLRFWQVPANESWQPRVTLRHLLSHTAGTTVHGFPGYRHGGRIPELAQILGGQDPANTSAVRVNTVPGLQFRYSGGGTTIVQQVLMDVVGMSFPALMQQLVLRPLGMEDSTYEQPLPSDRWADAATGHWLDGAPVAGSWHVYPEMAAAGLWTTPADLARVIVEVQTVKAGGTGKLLARAIVDEMLAPKYGGPFGIGFEVGKGDGAIWFGHGGSNAGFKNMLTATEHGAGAVVMTNGDMGSSLCQEIVGAIAREYIWPPAPSEDYAGFYYPAREPVPIAPDVYASYAGEYEARPNFALRVGVKDATLTLQPAGQPALNLSPLSETRFYAKSLDIEVTFQKNETGETNGLIFRQNAADMPARRLGATGAQP
jgi:CubicO group peptidase (beta-lactamase class C family)